MTYDHTDADVPMMQPVIQTTIVVDQGPEFRPRYVERPGCPLDTRPIYGSIGFDDNGDAFARTYPPQGMRCS